MPVTIHTMTSSVNVTEGAALDAETLEHLVKMVLQRVRQEHQEDLRSKQDRKLSDRMSPRDED